jgi:hypothetical protein
MSDDMERFLNLRRLPAMLDEQEAAWLTGQEKSEIEILVRNGVFRPLGNRPPNGKIKLSTASVLRWAQRDGNLHGARTAISGHWREKNSRRKNKPDSNQQ